jgi:sortase (surface protein transpeptidase)
MTAVARSVPTRLLIPSIGITTSVGSLGLQPNGQIMVPATVHTVGWYRFGPTPGQFGAAVILGHVDSYVGPGVFFSLKDLHAGALISVVLADGATTHFKVNKVVEYSKTNFPDRLVYTAKGARELNLVTCGGAFDHATGHYESNVVVFSQFTGITK